MFLHFFHIFKALIKYPYFVPFEKHYVIFSIVFDYGKNPKATDGNSVTQKNLNKQVKILINRRIQI